MNTRFSNHPQTGQVQASAAEALNRRESFGREASTEDYVHESRPASSRVAEALKTVLGYFNTYFRE